MDQFQVPDFIEAIVANIRDTGQVYTAVESPINTWTITTDTVENLQRFIRIDSNGAVFEVISVDGPGLEFVVKAADKTLGTPPLDLWKSQAPYFHHGTPTKLDSELSNQLNKPKVYPAVLMLETLLVDKIDDDLSNIYISTTPRLFFMASAESARYTTNKHYEIPVSLMQIYVDRFNKAIDVHPHIAERTSSHSENVRVDWGEFITNQGNVKKIITADLSGIEYTSLFEIEESVLCDFDPFVFPRPCPNMTALADSQTPVKTAADLEASVNDAAIKIEYCGAGAGSVNVNQSDGNLISNVPGDDPAAEYNVANTVISSTGAAFSDSVKATDPYVIEDFQYIDTDLSTQSAEYGTIPVCTIPSSPTIYKRLSSSGQHIQFFPFDEGAQSIAGAYIDNQPPGQQQQLDYASPNPHRTVLYDNIHGTRDRLTDDLGTQVYANGVIQEHLCGYEIISTNTSQIRGGTPTLVSDMLWADTLVYAGRDGWRILSAGELIDVGDTQVARWYTVFPFACQASNFTTNSIVNSGASALQTGLFGTVDTKGPSNGGRSMVIKTL